jgi:hypothetical protein
MNGHELAKAIEDKIKATLPECFVSVRYSYGIYPSIFLRFAKGKDASQWSNGIIQNDPLFLTAMIDGFVHVEYVQQTEEIKAGKLKGENIKLESSCNNNHKFLPLRGKTATPEKMIDYLERYFLRVKAIL